MKLSIIVDDKSVTIDGKSKFYDFDIDDNIFAVQWNGESGTIERRVGGSEHISSMDQFQSIVDAFDDAVDPNVGEPPLSPDPEEPQTVEKILLRNSETGLVKQVTLDADGNLQFTQPNDPEE